MIEVKGLSKSFGNIKAVNDISFQVSKGEILGFLGPNGAGKSTTMKMITGFLAPTAGTVIVGGNDVTIAPLEVKKRIGYLPETSASYPDMTVESFLEFVGEIRGFAGEELQKRIDQVIERTSLQRVRFQSIDTLSKGFRQRVGFAQAILHDPEVLILDEPTDGLDPNQKHEIRNLIREMGTDKCIILSTHILEEVDAVCTRAVIISEGKIVMDGTPDEIRQKSGNRNVVTVSLHHADPAEAEKLFREISDVEKIEATLQKEGIYRFQIYPRERKSIISLVSKALSTKNWAVENLHCEQGRLDEVFRNLTTGGKR